MLSDRYPEITLREQGRPQRSDRVRLGRHGLFRPDELERPVQTWGKAEKHEGEAFVPSSTVQGWRAGVLLHWNCEKTVFRVDPIRWSDNRDCFFSTRSYDPSGRGVDRGGVTTICTFLTREPPLGFNEDPASPISG